MIRDAVKEATPSTPVEILGLNSVPSAGETFVACDSEKEAKAFSDTYISEEKNKLIEDTKAKMSLDDLFSQIQSGNMKDNCKGGCTGIGRGRKTESCQTFK